MAMIGKVLRMHHRENKSVREIARATSLSESIHFLGVCSAAK